MALSDQLAIRDMLFKLEPYDRDLEETVALYVASDDAVTAPDDVPASQLFLGVIAERPTFRRSLVKQNGRFGGASFPARGSLVLGNGGDLVKGEPGDDPHQVRVVSNAWFGGELDAWLAYAWAGHRFTSWLKERGRPFAEAERKMSGRFVDLDYERDRLMLPLRDRQLDEGKVLNATRTYAGTGGLDGDPSLKGKYRPAGYGPCFNKPAVVVDPILRFCQVHHGQIKAIGAVRDKGITLTPTLVYPPVPVMGVNAYFVDLDLGGFYLAEEPAGLVTVDFEGCKKDGVYAETMAQIYKRMAVDQLGYDPDDDFDNDSLDALDALNASPVGVWAGPDGRSFAEMADELLASGDVFRTFTEDDKAQLGRIDPPTITGPDDPDCALVLTEDDIAKGSLQRVNPGVPASEIVVTWGYNEAIQSEDALAGGVTLGDRILYGQASRSTDPAAGVTAAAYPTAERLTIESRFGAEVDAEAERDRAVTIYGVPSDVFACTALIVEALDVKLGDQVWISHSRFNLAEGRAVRVVGTDPDWQRTRNGLQLWGPR